MKKKNNLKLGMLALAAAAFVLAGCNSSDSNGSSDSAGSTPTGGNGDQSSLTGGDVEPASELMTITAGNVPAIFMAAIESLDILNEQAYFLTQELASDASWDLDYEHEGRSSGTQGCDGGGEYTFSIAGGTVAGGITREGLGQHTQTFSDCDLEGTDTAGKKLNGTLVYSLKEEGDGHLGILAFDALSVGDDKATEIFNGYLSIELDKDFDSVALSSDAFGIAREEEGVEVGFLRVYGLNWENWGGNSFSALFRGLPEYKFDFHDLGGSLKLSATTELNGLSLANTRLTEGAFIVEGDGDLSISIEVTSSNTVTVALLNADGDRVVGCEAANVDIDTEDDAWWSTTTCSAN